MFPVHPTAYTLRKARRRKLQTLSHPLLPGGNGSGHFHYENADCSDSDSDSGISQENGNFERESTFLLPRADLAKTELAARLASATATKPAFIKARVLWKYEPIREHDLTVEKGAIIQLLHREGERVFASTGQGQKGFLPFSYCTVLRKFDTMTNGVSTHDVISNGHDVISNGNDVTGNGHVIKARENGNDVQHRVNGFHEGYQNGNGMPHIVSASKVYFHGDQEDGADLTAIRHSGNVPENATSLNGLPGNRSNAVQRCASDDALCHNERKQRLHRLSSSMDNVTKSTRNSSSDFGTDRIPSATLAAEMIQWDRRAPESYYRRQKLLVSHFRKYSESSAMVRFDFQALDENDISVERGEIVRVLNKDDPEWWWIARDDGLEGFVPSSYLAQDRLENVLGEANWDDIVLIRISAAALM